MRAPEDRSAGFYHCLSRVVDRRFIFEAGEKEHFVALLRECEAFCEVRVLTYCVMSNHFHLLVEVPRRPERLPSAEEVMAKLERLSGHQSVGAVRQQLEGFRRREDAAGEQAWLATYHARMWDVSAFMKLFKQRLTQWYNGRTGRKGTLWEDRFKSVLVEGAGQALVTMAAYIDLNPVRAGLAQDPGEYRWSGYGEAVAGRKRAKEGVRQVVRALLGGGEETMKRSMEIYRTHVYREGSEMNEAVGEDGRPKRGALRHEEVLRVLEEKGRLSAADYLRCRVRYFCDGAVFGSREFVEEIFRAYRPRFGAKRKDGARRVRGLADGGLFTLRDLRMNVFG